MNWYLAKIVYRIVCGAGEHTPQFDEQLRLVEAASLEDAFAKAATIGVDEEDTFCNQKQQLVQWRFVDVAELYHLSGLVDGAEVCSQIREVEDATAYTTFVHQKARNIRDQTYIHARTS
jgi:hypothetical protein